MIAQTGAYAEVMAANLMNSNAIEGNTLTINETKVVLEGITVGGKTLSEQFKSLTIEMRLGM